MNDFFLTDQNLNRKMSRGNCVQLLGQCNQSMYSTCPGAQLSSALLSAPAKFPSSTENAGDALRSLQSYNQPHDPLPKTGPIGDYSSYQIKTSHWNDGNSNATKISDWKDGY
jgi:hypothetical protein